MCGRASSQVTRVADRVEDGLVGPVDVLVAGGDRPEPGPIAPVAAPAVLGTAPPGGDRLSAGGGGSARRLETPPHQQRRGEKEHGTPGDGTDHEGTAVATPGPEPGHHRDHLLVALDRGPRRLDASAEDRLGVGEGARSRFRSEPWTNSSPPGRQRVYTVPRPEMEAFIASGPRSATGRRLWIGPGSGSAPPGRSAARRWGPPGPRAAPSPGGPGPRPGPGRGGPGLAGNVWSAPRSDSPRS